MTIKLVLFDVDDTLCDYAGARALRLRLAFAAAFGAASIAAPADMEALIAESIALHPHGADHFPDLLAQYGIHDPEAVAAARRWYQTNRFHGLALFPEALDTLALVREARERRQVGLITNGPAEVQRAKIELLDLLRHVDFALISGEFGVAKPDPAIFEEALRLAGVDAEHAIFIGDSPEFDIAGAHASGIRSVWINRTGRPWSEPGAAPDHEIADLASLHALLHDCGN
jgi:HAD superfamily hydrolase (TIGR01549 family)